MFLSIVACKEPGFKFFDISPDKSSIIVLISWTVSNTSACPVFGLTVLANSSRAFFSPPNALLTSSRLRWPTSRPKVCFIPSLRVLFRALTIVKADVPDWLFLITDAKVSSSVPLRDVKFLKGTLILSIREDTLCSELTKADFSIRLAALANSLTVGEPALKNKAALNGTSNITLFRKELRYCVDFSSSGLMARGSKKSNVSGNHSIMWLIRFSSGSSTRVTPAAKPVDNFIGLPKFNSLSLKILPCFEGS